MLEKDIQLQILKYLRAIGAYVGKTRTMGVKRGKAYCFDIYTFRGFPDICFFYKDKIGFIECKSPGAKQSFEQIKFEQYCQAAGIMYILAYDRDDVVKILERH